MGSTGSDGPKGLPSDQLSRKLGKKPNKKPNGKVYRPKQTKAGQSSAASGEQSSTSNTFTFPIGPPGTTARKFDTNEEAFDYLFQIADNLYPVIRGARNFNPPSSVKLQHHYFDQVNDLVLERGGWRNVSDSVIARYPRWFVESVKELQSSRALLPFYTAMIDFANSSAKK